MITVKEFCKKYSVTHQTVYAKIKRKRQALRDHIFQKNKIMLLDEYAEKLLKPCRPETELEEKIRFLEIKLSEKNEKIENLTEEVNCKKNKISLLEQELKKAQNEIFQLGTKLDSFERNQIIVDDKSSEKKKNVFGKLGGIIGKI